MLKQSERAATPFLISKQPYFPPFLLRRGFFFLCLAYVSPESLWFSLFASLADLSPQLISRHSTFLLRAPTFPRALFANVRHSQPVLRAVLRSYPLVAPISLPRHFRPPCRFRCTACVFHFNSFTPFILFSSLIVSFARSLRRRYLAKGGTSADSCNR